jgi:hypothetical protein
MLEYQSLGEMMAKSAKRRRRNRKRKRRMR